MTQSLNAEQRADPRIPTGAFVWETEPIRVALAEAAANRGDADEDYVEFRACTEVGRRLLLAQFNFNKWVLRRVEKVRFTSDRRVGRSSSIELLVPDYAPILLGEDGTPRWLVPLSVMRRRTLVNLDIRDEQNTGVSLLGLRFTQKLDEALLRAAARLAHPQGTPHQEVDEFVVAAVSGDWKNVKDARDLYEGWRRACRPDLDDRPTHDMVAGSSEAADVAVLAPYFRDRTFRASLERLWHNFILYAALPVDRGRHRLLHLAFEEGVTWHYQLPLLEEQDGIVEYRPIAKEVARAESFAEFLGWEPTRIRFLTPSAENCASYHFEFTAPTGLWVTSAALVAGRPNLDLRGVTPWDSVNSTGHSAGLHVVEVPNGSLCRAQVDLRVPSRGWLSTLAVACWAVFIVMAAAAAHARLLGLPGQWTTTQVTNIVLLLVTVCGGVSTYVAQHPSVDVAARMLSGLRIIGVLALSLPAVAAVSIVFLRDEPQEGDLAHHPAWLWGPLPDIETRTLLVWWLSTLAVLSAVAALMVSVAWLKALQAEKRGGRASPWDMTAVESGTGQDEQPIAGGQLSFDKLKAALGLDSPAVGVNSAEGWHERYGWNDVAQREALELLGHASAPGSAVHAGRGSDRHGTNSTSCECRAVWVNQLGGAPHASSKRPDRT